MKDTVYLISYNRHFENSAISPMASGKRDVDHFEKKENISRLSLTYSDVTQGFT